MKEIIFIFVVLSLLVFAVGCDTELGHSHVEDHDHDGIPDHPAEEHCEDSDEDVEECT